MNKTAEQISGEKEMISKQMVEELKRKNQYLPLIFKEINAIGFLMEQGGTTSKDDDDLLSSNQPIQVSWINITTSGSIKNMYNNLKNMFGVGVSGIGFGVGITAAVPEIYNIIKNFLGLGAEIVVENVVQNAEEMAINATNATVIAGGSFIASNTTAPFIALNTTAPFIANATGTEITSTAVNAALNTSAYSSYLTYAAIVFGIYDIWQFVNSDKVTSADILGSFALQTIFSKITDERYITVASLEQNASTLFIESLNLDFLKGFNETNGFLNKIRAGVNVVTSQFDTKTIKKETTNEYSITKYTNSMPEPDDIRRKLTNLNIPFNAFYYGLTIVKSTYAKDTGEMLKQYYDNKDKFMEKYKKNKGKG